MTKEEARGVLGDVRAYLASRASLENEMLAGHTFTDICNAIKALEQTRWIPVSERLPEDNIHVLCQFYLGGMGECYLAHGAFHVVGGLVMTCNEVIAWMPLPQPYKSESEDAE